MSKIQSAIQKAIEKSRGGQTAGSHARRDTSSAESGQEGKAGSAIFRIFQPASPDKEIMEESRVVSAIDDRTAIAAYNVLRTRVLQRMRNNGWRTLLVTSPGPGEGKTLTALNLAVSLSRDVNQSVMLVDLDLQRFTVAKYFGFDSDVKAGIGEYLMGSAEIAEIIYVPSNLERITVIPNREAIDNSSDLLARPRMKELLAWLREQLDRTIIIFDMPPVLACDDVLAFCPDVDSVLLVVAEGQTDRAALDKTMGLLAETNLLGVVLNKSDELGDSEAYGYY